MIKHNGGCCLFLQPPQPKPITMEGSHDSYLWLPVSKGVALDLFVYVVYVAIVGSKHESKSLFQNLTVNIVEVQILKGIILLGGDFNVRTIALPNTIDISDLRELLQTPKLAETKQPNTLAKR
jgi:hypothetical protein